MSSPSVCLVLLLLCFCFASLTLASPDPVSSEGSSDVIVLTDQNFDSLTQATSGSSGDWLIEFYAPWCGHCKQLVPIWEQVGHELLGKVSVAKVDATQSTYTAKRFDIKGYPTIKLLSGGLVYDYSGQRSREELVKFASQGSNQASASARPVPPPVGFFELVVDSIVTSFTDVKMLIMRKPEASLVIFAVGVLCGVLASVLVFALFMNPSNNYPAYPIPSRTNVIEPTAITAASPKPAEAKKSQ